jgi:hypothetical protein
MSVVTKEKLRECNIGKKHSEESKQKMSFAHLGNTYTKGFKHSKEFGEKISKRVSGENNPMYGVPSPMTGRVGRNNPQAKKYVITTPKEEKFIIHGMFNFCNNYTEEILHHSSLIKVAKGKQKHHKGYRCRYFEKQLDSNLIVYGDV